MQCVVTETLSIKKEKCNQCGGVVKPDKQREDTAVPSGFVAVYTGIAGATGEGVQGL